MKTTVAAYTIDFLTKKGMEDIFVLTGHGAMYLNDAIAAKKGLRFYCPKHESTAAIMAEGYARLKGSFGTICVTAGPGAANTVPGLAEAWADNAPIVVLSGQVPKKHTTYMAKIPGLRSFGTAELNIIPIVTPLTKYAVFIEDPLTIRYHLEKALYLAFSGKPGPVWIDIPLDVQSAVVDPKKLKGFYPPKQKKRKQKLSKEISKLTTLLQKSKRPLIIAGNGIRQSDSVEDFKKLIDLLRIPVIFSRLGIDILPYSHPFNMGLGGIRGNKHSGILMKSADLVISLGSRLSIPVVGYNLDAFADGAKIVSVDIDSPELEKPGVKLTLPINENLSDLMPELLKILKKQRLPVWEDWLKHCQQLKIDNPMITKELERDPIDLYYFMSRLDSMSNEKHILTSDSGSNYYIAGQIYHFEKGQKEISSIGFGAMGITIPLAVGASIAKPDHQVLAVTGDGSLELNIQDLKTISYYNLDIKLFVINNGGYVSMRNWQDSFFKGRRIGADDKSGVGMLNLEKVAEAFDLNYEVIESYLDIDSKLKRILKKKGPLFIEVVCRQDQTLMGPLNPDEKINHAS